MLPCGGPSQTAPPKVTASTRESSRVASTLSPRLQGPRKQPRMSHRSYPPTHPPHPSSSRDARLQQQHPCQRLLSAATSYLRPSRRRRQVTSSVRRQLHAAQSQRFTTPRSSANLPEGETSASPSSPTPHWAEQLRSLPLSSSRSYLTQITAAHLKAWL